MARKRGSRFRKVADAQEQRESIEKAQRRSRQSDERDKIIESIEKSKQRETNAYKKIAKPSDLSEEFD